MAKTTRMLIGSVIAAVGISAVAQAQDRLPRSCRQEIIQLCGNERDAVTACLRERSSELSADCREALSQRMQARRTDVQVPAYPGPAHEASVPDTTLEYGDDPRQIIHFYNTESADAPLILFIHGGGWTFGNPLSTIHYKADHFTSTGYAFASVGYRLVPDVRVEDQANDIVTAIAHLQDSAANLGFDVDRIVLMGHSAGAHLAALTATDERVSGPVLDAIAGVVLLDGAGYDVPRQMASDDTNYPELYLQAFGEDRARQHLLSPLTHVGGRDAPDWLILHVAYRENSTQQSRLLADALEGANANASAVAVRRTSHGRMNQELGIEGDFTTRQVDEFLARLFD